MVQKKVKALLSNAGGIANTDASKQFAESVVQKLQESKAVHFLSLDADRAYPKKNINVNEIAQAYEIDWEGVEYTKGRSFKTTTTLYDEWLKYFLAQENQSGTRLIKETMRIPLIVITSSGIMISDSGHRDHPP